MFRVGSLDAIRKGNTESWQQQYREVGQLDNTKDLGKEMQPGINEMQKQYAGMPDGAEKAQLAQQLSAQLKQQQQLNGKTEAILKGYAKDMNDNGYKKLAEDAVVDLQHLQKLYDKTEHEHFDHFNPNSRDLTDHIFERKANLYLQGKHLAAFKAKLDAEDAADIIADLNSNDASLAARTANQHDSYIQTIRKLQADHDEVIRAQKDKDIEAQKALARKYSMPGFNDADLPAAMESLKSKLNDVIDGHVNRVDQLRDSITNSPAFTKWQEKNPDKSVKEFIAGANYNLWSSAKHAEYQAAKSAHDIAQENLKSVLSPKGHAKLTRSIAEDREKTQKELNKEAQAANVAAYIRQMERNAAATIGKDNIGRQIENIQKQIKELEAQEKELSEQIKSLHAKYKETKKKHSIQFTSTDIDKKTF